MNKEAGLAKVASPASRCVAVYRVATYAVTSIVTATTSASGLVQDIVTPVGER
jgi:hypothetical protein